MQRKAALRLKEFVEAELDDGKVTISLERDSPGGYAVSYEGPDGGFTLSDIRQADAFIRGFAVAKGIYCDPELFGEAAEAEAEAVGGGRPR